MKLLIINNLASGYGEGAVYDFIRSLARDGDEVCMRSTDGTTDLRGMLDDASSFDAVVASGGDGTVATVSYLLTGTGIPILPFPAGTANLLALNLASPNEPHALAKILRAGATLDFDLGEIEVQGQRFGFGIMAGAGYDALIMHGAEPAKRLLGPMAYFSAALSNPLPQTARFAIELDGETIERDGLGILIVNFSKIQFDISVTHKNQPRDGVLDVVVLRAGNAFELIPAVLAGLLDRGGDFPDRTDSLEIHQARQVRVDADPPMEVQYDGEATRLMTPFSARILPGAARFVVSEECLELVRRGLSAAGRFRQRNEEGPACAGPSSCLALPGASARYFFAGSSSCASSSISARIFSICASGSAFQHSFCQAARFLL